MSLQHMVDAFEQYGQLHLENMSNDFYEGVLPFNFLFKKQNLAARQNSTDFKDVRGMMPQLDKFDGWGEEISIRVQRMLDKTRVDQGFSIKDGDPIVYDEGGKEAKMLSFEGAQFGIAMTVKDAELKFWWNLAQRDRGLALEDEFKKKWEGFKGDFLYKIADGVYNGKGVITPYLPNTSPYNTSIATPPANNELEGWFNYMFDADYDYGGLDISAYPYFAPKVYDFQATSSNDLGYSTHTNLNSRSKLVSTTNSLTANTPIIIDIIQKIIRKGKIKGEKYDLAVTSKDMFDTIVDAFYASRLAANGNTEKEIDKLMSMGFDNAIVIDGCTFIPEETSWESGTSATPDYVFPADTIIFLNTKYLNLKANSLDNFKMSGWHTVPGIWNTQANELSVHLINYCSSRRHQAVAYFPTVDYSA